MFLGGRSFLRLSHYDYFTRREDPEVTLPPMTCLNLRTSIPISITVIVFPLIYSKIGCWEITIITCNLFVSSILTINRDVVRYVITQIYIFVLFTNNNHKSHRLWGPRRGSIN